MKEKVMRSISTKGCYQQCTLDQKINKPLEHIMQFMLSMAQLLCEDTYEGTGSGINSLLGKCSVDYII